ncbi:uncharacterized protein [Ptychodera flava]|uniref:uncharacterized protein n=1 Tax=Ptychodera flava TaxID=63121 RepID=UPI00396A2A05
MAPNSSKHKSQTESDGRRKLSLDSYLRSALNRFVKGATTGFAIYSVVTVVKAILQKRLAQSPGQVLKDVFSIDSLRFTLFLGSLPAVYKLALYYVHSHRKQTTGANYVIASAIAALTCLIENAERRSIIAVFLSSRAIGALYNALVKREKIPPIKYDVPIAFGAATSIIVYGLTLNPKVLSDGYYKTALAWSRDYTEEMMDNVFRKPGSFHIPCDPWMHQGRSCLGHGIRELVASWLPYSRVYMPIHVIPFLLFRRKALLKRPSEELMSLLIKVCRSATFLCVMCTTIKTLICMLRNHVDPRPPPLPAYIPLIAGFIGAFLGVQFEIPSRQSEMALYFSPSALNAVYLIGRDKKVIPTLPFGSVILFVSFMAVIMHSYERDEDSLSPMIHKAVKLLFGEPEKSKQEPDDSEKQNEG